MTVGQLITQIGDYLQITFKPLGDQENDPQVVEKFEELGLIALNNARTHAEQLHDFLAAETRVQLTVDTISGGALSSALTYVPGGAPSGSINVKNILGAWGLNSDGFIAYPIDVRSSGHVWTNEREIRQARVQAEFPELTSNDDDLLGLSWLYRLGDTLFVSPKADEDKVVVLDVSQWMADYTVVGDTDWFTERGAKYMFYAGIIELNDLWQTFVARQEGTPPPPTGKRDEALRTLITLDSAVRSSSGYRLS